MSEKHLYEKHLAEKLQQLSPPPDMEGNWQKMKALLDDDSPRGGGYKRWWRIGVIAAILLTGSWFVITQLSTTNQSDKLVAAQTPNPANVDEKRSSPAEDGTSANPNTPRANGTATTPAPDNEVASTAGAPISNSPAADGSSPAKDAGAVRPSPGKPNSGSTNTVNKDPDRNLFAADIGPRNSTTRNNPGRKNNTPTTTNNSTIDDRTVLNNKKINANNQDARIDRVQPEAKYSPLLENVNYTASLSPAPAENLKTDFNTATVSKTTLSSKTSRAARSKQEKTCAFGISLPLAFPLGDQKALSYNFNAGANTVSDYLPAPHVQYHLNKKTYLQTELQFVSPQYIRPILLYETRTPQSGYYVYNSIYARKLYYFNLPIGIHHSPFPNFYLGTGLQFSSLLSGVGLYEETKRNMNGQAVSLLSERYGRLSGDTLSDRMNRAEVRLMLEANYYVNRFTFGLRYNQAFNNYVSFQLNSLTPYTFDKNKALLFYLRYNLWEQKKTSSKGMLSSK